MINKLLLLPLLLVGAQEDKVRIQDKRESGRIRISQVETASETAITQGSGDYKYTMKSGAKRKYEMQDWFLGSKLLRSYGKVEGSKEEGGTALPLYDSRQHHTFVLDVNGSKLSFPGKAGGMAKDEDLPYVLDELVPDCSTDKAVAVGESWDVPAERFAPSSLQYKGGECTAKLEGVEKGVATISFRAKLRLRLEVKDLHRVDLEGEIAGKIRFDIAAGGPVQTSIEASFAGSGKINTVDADVKITSREARSFRHGTLKDEAVQNGSEGPDSVNDVYASKLDAVPAHRLILARSSGAISRLQTFDPSTKKIEKTLLALPKGVLMGEPALSPSRSKIAFVSNGNNLISHSQTNVFVYETSTGKLNQITPSWATGTGLAQAAASDRKVTIRGRVSWFDDERSMTRHDVLMGYVKVDRTTCFAQLSSDGIFEVKDVPTGVGLLVVVKATLPNYSTGKRRHEVFGNQAQASTVVLLSDDKDLGDLTVHIPSVSLDFDNPSWAGDDALVCQYSSIGTAFRIGTSKRSWTEIDLGGADARSTKNCALSPDGKWIAMGSGHCVTTYDASNPKQGVQTNLADHITVDSGRMWLKDSSGWICSAQLTGWMGEMRFGVPALLLVKPAEKQVYVIKTWPQATGGRIQSVALDAEENVAYIVVQTTEKDKTFGDLWAWDSRTDATTRLTQLGDVVGVANRGK